MTENSKTKQPQHVRVMMGLGTIDPITKKGTPFAIRESLNPHPIDTDGEFVRRAKLAEHMEQMAKDINANNANLKKVIEELGTRIAKIESAVVDLQNRVAQIEIICESVIKSSHRREPQKLQDAENNVKAKEFAEHVEIHEDPEMAARIAEIEKRAKERGVLR